MRAMPLARTASLLLSIFWAGIVIGYGTVPVKATRAVAYRVGTSIAALSREAGSDPASAGWPKEDPPSAPTPRPALPPNESNELRLLASPEFQLFGERLGRRPESSAPPPLCGTGTDRRICSATESTDPTEADARWMVGLRAPDLPVHASFRVERFFRYLTESTAGRKVFRSWLKRSGRYHEVVSRALEERGLPQDLEAVVFVESGYSPTAVSSEGATGLWQFMAGTARVYGLAVDDDFDERRSIEKATQVATRYLSDLYERFGSWELALAAYDMGYGRLSRRVQELSTNDYWTLSLVSGALPDEALSYVPKVIAVALLLRNLDRYGFDQIQVDPEQSAAELEVPGGTPLRLVARASGTSVNYLHQLNPELLRNATPDRGGPAIVHVPSSGLARANVMLPRLLARWRPDHVEDNVGDGFDWGVDELVPRRRLGGTGRSTLWDDPMSSVAPADDGSATSEDDAVPADEGRPSPAQPSPPDDDSATVFYRVAEGETLGGIAHAFGVRKGTIVADNRLDPVAKLQKGMLLKLQVPRSAVSRLASERTLDDSQYAPPVRVDPGGSSLEVPIPRVKHPHGGRSSGRRLMADWPELSLRKP
jgi:membrane-bound lytic murein transglycosylase D